MSLFLNSRHNCQIVFKHSHTRQMTGNSCIFTFRCTRVYSCMRLHVQAGDWLISSTRAESVTRCGARRRPADPAAPTRADVPCIRMLSLLIIIFLTSAGYCYCLLISPSWYFIPMWLFQATERVCYLCARLSGLTDSICAQLEKW